MVVVVTFVDSADQMYRKLQITSPGGEFRVFELDYQASGSDIFIPTEDRTKNYGSSILPLHLFRYDSTEDHNRPIWTSALPLQVGPIQ